MIALLLASCLIPAQEKAPEKTPEKSELLVPSGPAVELDGKLGAEEWKGALAMPLGAGGELLLRHDERYLYVGVRGKGSGWAHLYLQDGDTVVVRHASAALGSAVYAKDELGKWQPTQAFPARDAWALRDSSLTPEARASRQAFLEREGWVASNNAMGKSEFEFILARKGLGEHPLLAVAFLSNPTQPLLFPARLADGCADARLLTGATPNDLDFQPGTWGHLSLAPEASSVRKLRENGSHLHEVRPAHRLGPRSVRRRGGRRGACPAGPRHRR